MDLRLTDELRQQALKIMQSLYEPVVDRVPGAAPGIRFPSVFAKATQQQQNDVFSCLVSVQYAFQGSTKLRAHFMLNMCLMWRLYLQLPPPDGELPRTEQGATRWLNEAIVDEQLAHLPGADWVKAAMREFSHSSHLMADLQLACDPDPPTIQGARRYWKGVIDTMPAGSLLQRFKGFTLAALAELALQTPNFAERRERLDPAWFNAEDATRLINRLKADAAARTAKGADAGAADAGAAASGAAASGAAAKPSFISRLLGRPSPVVGDDDRDPEWTPGCEWELSEVDSDPQSDSEPETAMQPRGRGAAVSTAKGGKLRRSPPVAMPMSLTIGMQLPASTGASRSSKLLSSLLLQNVQRRGPLSGSHFQTEEEEDMADGSQLTQPDDGDPYPLRSGAASNFGLAQGGASLIEKMDRQVSELFAFKQGLPQYSNQALVGWALLRKPQLEYTAFLLDEIPQLRRALDEQLQSSAAFYGEAADLIWHVRTCPLRLKHIACRLQEHREWFPTLLLRLPVHWQQLWWTALRASSALLCSMSSFARLQIGRTSVVSYKLLPIVHDDNETGGQLLAEDADAGPSSKLRYSLATPMSAFCKRRMMKNFVRQGQHFGARNVLPPPYEVGKAPTAPLTSAERKTPPTKACR